MPQTAVSSPAPNSAIPSLRQRITNRSWLFVQSAAGAARRTHGTVGVQTLVLLRRFADADPARALRLARRARRLSPGSGFLAQAEALLTARTRGWEAAAPLFADPRAARIPGAAASLLRRVPAPALHLALPALERPVHLPEAAARETVIYTTAFGEDPAPAPLYCDLPGLRLLCLTDRADLQTPGWEAVRMPPEAQAETLRPQAQGERSGAGPAAVRAWCQIRAHRALAAAAPEAQASLYLAPDRRLVGNLHTLMTRWLMPHDLVLWRHPGGIDWHDLAEHRLIGAAAGSQTVARVIAQARDCAARGLPRNAGAYDTGMIWRRHARPEVVALMEAWWAAFARQPGSEAIALYAALNPPGPRGSADAPGPAARAPLLQPRTMPAALGGAQDNAFLAAQPAPRPRPRRGPPAQAGRRLGIAFVYAEKYAASASTFLRGRQLSEMVAAAHPARYDMAYTSDLDGLRDRVVVLTKGALEVHSAARIAELARRNVAVIGSWDDMLPEPDKMAALTASMTLSHRQTRDFARLHPATPAYHVTHHVNSQIRPGTPPQDRLRAGYFGALTNTRRPASLGHLVDLIRIDTSKVEMNWLDALPRYNCHWIVRRSKPHDGWKPFLKGFVAARCGAVVAVGREDEDAAQYLGDDYPFYVRSPDPAALEYDMTNIAAAFGGPDWRHAQAIMAQVAERSSDAQVCAEFRAMIEEVVG